MFKGNRNENEVGLLAGRGCASGNYTTPLFVTEQGIQKVAIRRPADIVKAGFALLREKGKKQCPECLHN